MLATKRTKNGLEAVDDGTTTPDNLAAIIMYDVNGINEGRRAFSLFDLYFLGGSDKRLDVVFKQLVDARAFFKRVNHVNLRIRFATNLRDRPSSNLTYYTQITLGPVEKS